MFIDYVNMCMIFKLYFLGGLFDSISCFESLSFCQCARITLKYFLQLEAYCNLKFIFHAKSLPYCNYKTIMEMIVVDRS